jgi:hypothetical protein
MNPAREALREALAGEGIEAGVMSVAVNDDEEARRPRFPGNPTIRLDGGDLSPAEGTANGRGTGGHAAAGTRR